MAAQCTKCPAPREGRSYTCAEHMTDKAIRNRTLREKKKSQGLCIQSGCWKESRPGKVRCVFHGEAANL